MQILFEEKKSGLYAGYTRVLTILPLDMKFGYKLNKKCDNIYRPAKVFLSFFSRIGNIFGVVGMVENLIYCLFRYKPLILCKINVRQHNTDMHKKNIHVYVSLLYTKILKPPILTVLTLRFYQ